MLIHNCPLDGRLASTGSFRTKRLPAEAAQALGNIDGGQDALEDDDLLAALARFLAAELAKLERQAAAVE